MTQKTRSFLNTPWQRLTLTVIYSLLFALIAWYFLVIKNADLLFALQDRGLWNDTSLFWHDCMRFPGGLLSWCGAYLTQYFYYPSLGATMLIVLWLLVAWLACWNFRVRAEWRFLVFVPVAALLCSIIQLGAWLYFIKDIDYTFYHSLGLLFALILSIDPARVSPNQITQNKWVRLVWMAIVMVLCYYPLGFYALLVPLFFAVQQFREGWRQAVPYVLMAAVLIGVVPVIENGSTTLMRPEARWLYGFRFFEIEDVRNRWLEVPFWVAALSPLCLPLVATYQQKSDNIGSKKLVVSQLTMLLCFGLMVYVLSKRQVDDYNFHAELRMQRAIDEQRWDDVLHDDLANPGNPTREMIMFRDIALLNRGELLDRHYTFNTQSVRPISIGDTLLVRISDEAGDLVYYNMGLPLFAVRRTVERCMHNGYSYYVLRNLTRCAIVNGEQTAAKKYLDMLSHSTFQRKWAESLKNLKMDSVSLARDKRFSIPFRLSKGRPADLGTDDNLVEYTTIRVWAHTVCSDPLLLNVALNYSLQLRDSKNFFAHFFQWMNLHPGEKIPLHLQECAILYAYEFKVPVDLTGVQFDPAVMERYKQFSQRAHQLIDQGFSVEQVGSMMRVEFGDTYWWDYCFLINVELN